MENVLNVTDETRQALAQLNIETITDLMDESYDTINSLEFYPTIKDNDGNDVLASTKKMVARGSIRLLMIFIDYCSYRYAQSDPITDWTTVTHDQFSNFRMMPNYMLAKNTIGKTVTRYEED